MVDARVAGRARRALPAAKVVCLVGRRAVGRCFTTIQPGAGFAVMAENSGHARPGNRDT